eukprot:gene36013-46790_t
MRPKYVEAIDGHPIYKWDQMLILREVFSRLETAGNGRVDAMQLASIRNDSSILELLRFTVLGTWVKRKQWAKFDNLLVGDRRSISLFELVQAALSLANEVDVNSKHVRTDEEHKAASYSLLNAMESTVSDGRAFKFYYAEETRKSQHRGLRDAYLSRVLAQGDCIWGMVGGTCMWLPAIIEAIRPNGSYDLSYPLTLGALQQAKVLATSRELLALPSQPASAALNSRPFRTEKEVCEYLFSMVSENKAEIDVDLLKKSMTCL